MGTPISKIRLRARQFFKGQVLVGVYADAGCDFQGLLDNRARIQLSMLQQRLSGCLRIASTRANRRQVPFRLDDIAIA